MQIVEQALGRPPARVVFEDAGYDFEVLLVDDEWVFRFPRRSGVVAALEVEIALLPELAPTLPSAVPRFEHIVREPVVCVGYRAIEGKPLSPDSTHESARDVGLFLSALHAFDVDRANALGVERPGWQQSYVAQCAEFERLVAPRLDPEEQAAAVQMFRDGIDVLDGFEPVLLHADLGPEHLLCAGGRLAGVIDWGDTRIGDPALDLTWLLHGTEPPFVRALAESYSGRIDERVRGRALFYHRLVPWYEAHYGLFTNQPARVPPALREIRARLPANEHHVRRGRPGRG
jgi:aminoglycoside phosphotransferase (APT) family kinase protein